MDAPKDGSESVDQFLARIASLNSKQGQEEAERSRRMEEEMLQARKERQARRAERARSLSPSKTGPTLSLRHVGETAPKPGQGIDPPVALTPPAQSRTFGRTGSMSPKADRISVTSLDFSRPLPRPLAEQPSVPSPPANATALSRSGTLSWKQRPVSRGTGSFRSRPQSVASIADISSGPNSDQPKNTDEMSREEIATSLGARDPSWFRQTADRGSNSAAYRKNDSEVDRPASFSSRSMRLPGMSTSSNRAEERANDEPQSPDLSSSPPKQASTPTLYHERTPVLEPSLPMRPVSMVSSSPSRSPVLDLPPFKPLSLTVTTDVDLPGLGRTSSVLSSAERPPSPTKGLGGFVQSAMMKRSDSVSKRWSVQANAGLKRGDSVASARPPHLAGVSGFSPGHSRNSSKDARGFMEGNSSPLSSSRPVSSHDSDPVRVTRGRPMPQPEGREAESQEASQPADTGSKQPEPSASFSQQRKNRPMTPPPPESPLDRSPSKTMDPRRWSPTKATWLESALNKQDSPRFTPAKPEIPAWKLNMQRSKAEQQSQPTEKASSDSKPATAAEALQSPPLRPVSPRREPRAEKTDAIPTSSSGTSSRNAPVSSSKPEMEAFSVTKKAAVEQNEGKPTIPSKRNVTPLSIRTSSPAKKEEAAPDAGPMQESVEKVELRSDTKPPIVKPKPQTPPKTDFRTNLKSRQAAPTAGNGSEPEFKAVFGKLKRTQTQHYVAPDTLKDNITRGKAALSFTGGPQKTKRVDEFKESILQKKDAMKAAGGSMGKHPELGTPVEKSVDSVPEALARRKTLHKTTPSTEKIDTAKAFASPNRTTAPAAAPQGWPEKPATLWKESSAPAQPTVGTPSKSADNQTGVAAAAQETRARPVVLSSQIQPQLPDTGKAANAVEPLSAASIKPKISENSKIAARLNPALAGLLSRSASPKLPADQSSLPSAQREAQTSVRSSSDGPSNDAPELSHMTKGRAKGPKRRAPNSNSSSKETAQPEKQEPPSRLANTVADSPSASQSVLKPTNSLPSRSFGARPSTSKPTTKVDSSQSFPGKPHDDTTQGVLPELQNVKGEPKVADQFDGSSSTKMGPISSSAPKPRPAVANKSAEVRKVSQSTTSLNGADGNAAARPSTPKKFEILTDRPVPVASPPESDGERKLTSQTPAQGSKMPLTPSKTKLNTPKPTKPIVESPAKPVMTTPAPRVNGLALQLGVSSRKVAATPELTPPPEVEVASSRILPSPSKASSPLKSSSTLKGRLETFFGNLPQAKEKEDFDTETFLTSQQKVAEKPRTLSNQIWEVSGDGKRTPMPPQQEHILFEDCMYLSVHCMQSSNGSRTNEVYLWYGDEVPEAAVEDAQLFCRKVARDNNAKLQVVKQGKESSEFFQALGGIVIIRRNKASALYMLCGKRHLGHVAFDEVDFSSSSLSSGFPFLISAKFGKLYLWKGVGANQQDVGCARLIGMDLGLTGEIEEVSEGQEPAGFWESFPSKSPRKSRTTKHPGSTEGRSYLPKLYRVDHDRPKSSSGFWGLRSALPPKQSNNALMEEIAPFTQRDLDPNHIHLLDIYEELYVLVGASAKKPAEFVTAVQVAQEIAVLAPSIQDRSLLPACYVVMGDPPQKIKDVFRKWRPDRTTASGEPLCVRVEEVLGDLGITL
ncbi:hypothetical protein LTS15_010349 [Exophiala xenobiotica]|nr:hypothetical protein LTS15_010349 [Exophiala xenobiotica]